MGLYDEFRFKPASWLPHSELPLEELERVRKIRREDMEYTVQVHSVILEGETVWNTGT